ncbi:hypothetical protein NEMIN01_1720 [Nematocida minor]|uniref:uncharacterized protein n=1 Tax=Nematocida minor TaxID=1912983 RepID=UPI00221F1E07|nr:uncharacterized protein NEMIN01_1720 [Nematocida minor]KAI5191902.1 hypothetical protein NEMIN01_1720 [Nematocida minor]
MFVCRFEKCEKSFKKPSLLELHENVHLNKRVFVCGVCGKGYFKNSHLKVHFLRSHTEGESRACDACGKMLASEEGLKRHKEVCGRTFTCEVCKMEFVRAKWYLTHMRGCVGEMRPDGAEPLKEEERPNRKKQKKARKEEKELHRCTVCHRGYKIKRNCVYHEKHAHGGVQYECSKCSKVYKHKGSLTRHIEKEHKSS